MRLSGPNYRLPAFYFAGIIFSLFGCHPGEKQAEENSHKKISVSVFPKEDTLPNGKRLLDDNDENGTVYYKELGRTDTLKGDYITCYGIDDSTKYFYLRHGDTLRLLNKCRKYQSTWSLGTLDQDYDDFFVTVLDNGNSCPASFEVFDKKTGRNKLGEGRLATSRTFYGDTLFFLCLSAKKSGRPDSMYLWNIMTMKKKGYKIPADIPEYFDIQIDTVAPQFLKIKYYSFLGDYIEKSKVYKR